MTINIDKINYKTIDKMIEEQKDKKKIDSAALIIISKLLIEIRDILINKPAV